ncbi:MAG TPA: hypothetical protein VHF51_16655, partial [Solirubrobacteraceae bacterium]|nr:hypothetical protein [Solirubrobacteraceae bacterium]
MALDPALAHRELVRALVLVERPLHAKRRPSARTARAVVAGQALGRLGPRRGRRAHLPALGAPAPRGGTDFDRVPPEWRDAMMANAAAIVAELRGGDGEHIASDRFHEIRVPTTLLLGPESDPVSRPPRAGWPPESRTPSRRPRAARRSRLGRPAGARRPRYGVALRAEQQRGRDADLVEAI